MRPFQRSQMIDGGPIDDGMMAALILFTLFVTFLSKNMPSSCNVGYQSESNIALHTVIGQDLWCYADDGEAPKSTTNVITTRLQDCVTEILDELASRRRMMKWRAKPSNRWLSTETIEARRNRRQLERHYYRIWSKSARQAFRASSRCANHSIKASWWEFYAWTVMLTAGRRLLGICFKPMNVPPQRILMKTRGCEMDSAHSSPVNCQKSRQGSRMSSHLEHFHHHYR